jgi:methionine-rich copper-binding protein CopC
MKSLYKVCLLGAFISAILFFAVPPVSAHAKPSVMSPAANSVVVSPAMVSITFTEAVEARYSSLKVADEHGEQVNTASSARLPNDKKTLTVALPSLQPGGYTVHWVSVADDDGHRVEGEYKFKVK